MVKRKGMKSGNRRIQKSNKINLQQPSYKWMLCRKCKRNEVKITTEAKSCVCYLCLTRACDYMPRIVKPFKNPGKTSKTINTFKNLQDAEKQQDKLAKDFKKKKAALKK